MAYYETSQFTPTRRLNRASLYGVPLGRLQHHAHLHDARNVLRPDLIGGTYGQFSSAEPQRARSERWISSCRPSSAFTTRKTFLGDKLKHVIEPRLRIRLRRRRRNFLNTLRFDSTDLLRIPTKLIGLTNRLYAERRHGQRNLYLGALSNAISTRPLAARLSPGNATSSCPGSISPDMISSIGRDRFALSSRSCGVSAENPASVFPGRVTDHPLRAIDDQQHVLGRSPCVKKYFVAGSSVVKLDPFILHRPPIRCAPRLGMAT